MFECSKLNQTFLPKSFFIINKKKKAQKVINLMESKPEQDPVGMEPAHAEETTDGAKHPEVEPTSGLKNSHNAD